jgi:hypothetical protein
MGGFTYRKNMPSLMKHRTRTVAIFALAAVSSLTFADLKVVSHLTVVAPMMNGPQQQDITTYVRNGVMRVETGTQGIVLINSKTHQSVVIDPATKTYSDLDPGTLTDKQKAAMKKANVKMTAHLKPTNEKMTIAGKPSKKYAITLLVTMDIPGEKDKPSMGSMKMNMSMDQWTTTAIKEHYSVKDMMQTSAQILKALTMMGDASTLTREFSKMKGYPLTNNTTLTIAMTPSKTAKQPPAGTPMTFTTTIKSEVKSISEAPLKADLFKIPAGYKKTTKPAKMPSMGGLG